MDDAHAAEAQLIPILHTPAVHAAAQQLVDALGIRFGTVTLKVVNGRARDVLPTPTLREEDLEVPT